MNFIFFNTYGRLRSGWRFAVYFALLILIALFLTAFIALVVPQESLENFFSSKWQFPAQGLIFTIIAVSAGWVCGKIFENLPFKATGWSLTKGWFKDFVSGSLIGGLTLFCAVFIGFVFHGLSFSLNQTVSPAAIGQNLLLTFGIFLLGAAGEEAIFRGYPLQTLTRSKLAWLAIALTSVFFAQVHAGNPNASIFGLINTVLAGIWLAAAYLKTRNLWFPLGLHWAWNWTLASVAGLPVSGITDISTNPLFLAADTGPTWLTGGHYGIEGGLACTIAMTVSTIFIWFAPFLKADKELFILTNQENPAKNYSLEIFTTPVLESEEININR